MDTETVIIIGRSDYITPEILDICKQVKACKVAINQYFGWVDYIAHIDHKPYGQELYYGNAIPLTLTCFNVPNSENYWLHTDTYDFKPDKNSLFYESFTHDFVISWAIMKGFKKIILIGCADFENDNHCDGSTEKFDPQQNAIIDSIKYINSFDNIYTINPNSKLKVHTITKEELKNGFSKKNIHTRG